MIEINIYKPIGINSDDDKLLEMVAGVECPFIQFSDIKELVDNTTENEIKLNIKCKGGSVSESLAIYDYLRQSGKTIYANIDGECHSSAIILLLSAPYENRTANYNSKFLIHHVRGVIDGSYTTDELENITEYIKSEEENILRIYNERTGRGIDELIALMNEEKERTASEMIAYGFISKTNIYNTNFKNEKMSKEKKSLLVRLENFLDSVKTVNQEPENETPATENFDHTAEDGTVIFTSESENITVGMPASPAGEFTLANGQVVTVQEVEGATVIVLIALSSEFMPVADTTVIDNLTNELTETKTNLTNAVALVNEFKTQVRSTFEPSQRQSTVNSASNVVKTVADLKNEAIERKNLKRK